MQEAYYEFMLEYGKDMQRCVDETLNTKDEVLALNEVEAKSYKEYVEWCDDAALIIKTATTTMAKLEETIEEKAYK
eukprot:15755366-Heterocapsa_arctica.AAC.1